MPVTKTAKRALRSSKKKARVNKLIRTRLEASTRIAKRKKTKESITKAISYTDRAAKKKVIHKNKAARIVSRLSKITPKTPRKAKVQK